LRQVGCFLGNVQASLGINGAFQSLGKILEFLARNTIALLLRQPANSVYPLLSIIRWRVRTGTLTPTNMIKDSICCLVQNKIGRKISSRLDHSPLHFSCIFEAKLQWRLRRRAGAARPCES